MVFVLLSSHLYDLISKSPLMSSSGENEALIEGEIRTLNPGSSGVEVQEDLEHLVIQTVCK